MASKPHLRDQFLFGLNYAALFSGAAIVLALFPVWLKGEGFSENEVGLILGAAFWLKVIIGPLFSSLADITGRRKLWLAVLAIGYFFVVLSLHQVTGFWPVALLWALGGAMFTTQIPISDSISVLAVRQRALDYGSARLWGSLSFIVVSLLAGWYVQGGENSLILELLTWCTGLAVLAVLFLPDLRSNRSKGSKASFWEAFRIPEFRTFVWIAASIQASHAALYGFASLHWQAAGLSESQIALLWAEGVVIEVLVFAFGRRLLIKLDIIGLLSLAILGGTLRWFVMGLTTDLVWLIAIQSLHACTYAATHLAVVTFITRRIPDHLGASAQGLYDVMAMGIIFGGAMWISGELYGALQGKTFWVMGAMTVFSGFMLLLNMRKIREGSAAPSRAAD
ncbi:MFS transporter [Aestuariispira insulae]|uniref:PPP family 3-phenylpropionic acid transporter n=1 Tax=Aestuariispira insulae TaxID=1461337 RepID=A0A3D9HNJ8_9PROT|nr:MFS transporter [Aestuariispira insulae]RED50871.1 PPP family 3-phenylpropionic acid transporter [Aestuariispira insulae]